MTRPEDPASPSASPSANAGLQEGVAALSASMPRLLIAEGLADDLARDWIARRAEAEATSLPAIPRYPFAESARLGLFEARRARRLVRGLEGIARALEAEAIGLSKAPATQTDSGRPRISRLLVVSADGAPRFYRAVEQLRARFASRLAVVLLECDEGELGRAAYGSDRRARALMLDHKQAVIEFFLILDELRREGESAASSS